MDATLVKKFFTLDRVPHWPCPACERGILTAAENDFRKEYNAETEAGQDDSSFDHSWVTYVFHGLLRCNVCKEKVVFCGTGEVDQEYDNSPEGSSYYDRFSPKFFYPTVRLIVIDNIEAVPDQVLSSVDKACELFWTDLDSSANRIRTTVEYILDNLKVPRRKGLTLHGRIEMLDHTKYADVQTVLEAVKWIGNAGSHELGGLDRKSVIDGFRMLEHCLSVLYPKPSSDTSLILAMAKAINDAKGPVKAASVRRKAPSSN